MPTKLQISPTPTRMVSTSGSQSTNTQANAVTIVEAISHGRALLAHRGNVFGRLFFAIG